MAVIEIDLLDEIGGWSGVETSDLVREIRDAEADEIRLNINSPGGSVFDGVAILNALRQHPAKVKANVLGVAASAASFIAAGCDEVIMAENSTMMVHDGSGIVYGNAKDMQDMADLLNMLSDNIASIYAAKAGGDTADWRAVMRETRWYTADEAVQVGLADRVDKRPAEDAPKHPENKYPRPATVSDARAALAMSEQLVATPAAQLAAHVPPSSTEPVEPNQKQEVTMSDVLKSGLHARLGITTPVDDITDEQLLAAVDEALAERAQAPEAQIPEGTVLIDAGRWEAVQADAAAGRQARDEQTRARRAQTVENAIADGRVPPARREHWIAALEADEEGASAVLSSLAAGLIPMSELGSANAADVTTREDDLARQAGWNTEEE